MSHLPIGILILDGFSDNEAFEGQYSIYIMGSNQEATITKYIQSESLVFISYHVTMVGPTHTIYF